MSPKEMLRGEIKSRLKEVSREDFMIQGARAAALLRSSHVWSCHATVFLFLSTNLEIDTQPLLEAALKDGKKVFAPKVSGFLKDRLPKDRQTPVFYRIHSAGGPWEKGQFGIREPALSPQGSAGSVPMEEDYPALIVAPGLAFDKNGNRLGKGGAYYDRLFGKLAAEGKRYAALGLCMDFQIVEKVPVEEHDRKMAWILSQNELLEVSNQGKEG